MGSLFSHASPRRSKFQCLNNCSVLITRLKSIPLMEALCPRDVAKEYQPHPALAMSTTAAAWKKEIERVGTAARYAITIAIRRGKWRQYSVKRRTLMNMSESCCPIHLRFQRTLLMEDLPRRPSSAYGNVSACGGAYGLHSCFSTVPVFPHFNRMAEKSKLEGVINFRDVSSAIGSSTGIAPGRLFRSSYLGE